ncbi:MAG TPA: site-specific DNA-methyltransferase [Polaromonas sp.]|uniref:site-specific DNA-methyltransferase n=1 Tax=Polaromonas sp. TaxID=1869339 RepID=UPI002D580140|nr:site-specific DNA-methyltransferase [Polaromonas sp.]HYW57458.1 site-specific DNA-methyltransferase [Polaromonas sp.]
MPFLDWVNKNQAKETTREVPYHLLKQESVHGDASGANADNLLIQGDNLLALKALIPFYAGRVKCIFIDPPYNTQSAFEHYDDKLEHSQWLSMMYPRLVLLRELLAADGTIWVSLDDNEAHYIKVMMDEIFGRQCFVANLIWEKADSPRNSARQFSSDHDHIFVFSRTPDWQPSKLPRTEESNSIYTNPDNDERGPWIPGDPYANKPYSKGLFSITGPSGRVFTAPPGRYWRVSEEKLRDLDTDGRVWWGPKGEARPSIKRYLSEVSDLVPRTLWRKEQAGSNRTSKNEMRALFPAEASFGTPKPEALVKRALQIATSAGDLVMDSFLGSGTTAAVAHKMGRPYIGIEMGEHARTHCLPRLQKVIDGEQGGASKAVEWQGGGGFRFCTLGEPAFDTDGRISAEVKFATLAAYVWHFETGEPGQQMFDTPMLGVHNGTAYYLLYNGILGDRRPAGGNVLTHAVLQAINEVFPHDGPKVVYGEMSRLGASRLGAEGITFKQIPYDVKMR